MRQCPLCANLIRVACDASRAFYELLADLDEAVIRGDAESAARLQEDVRHRALLRNAAIALLREHERTHEVGG